MTAHPAAEPTTQTRSQQLMSRAYTHVMAVQAEGEAVARAYGRWCHRIPALVLANGLCQTVAFLEDKSKPSGGAGGPSVQAGRRVREHLAQLVGAGGGDSLTDAVRRASLTEYMHQTRTVLAAWVYYKRFAVSLLGVEAGEDFEEPAS